ncbi:hypothetical protein C8Q80DRAFT_759165 [Daedaleopsis nitida]|nr:hypothetical protein C8Q80DRAFT_759165 [Daedaleopsis nitida]
MINPAAHERARLLLPARVCPASATSRQDYAVRPSVRCIFARCPPVSMSAPCSLSVSYCLASYTTLRPSYSIPPPPPPSAPAHILRPTHLAPRIACKCTTASPAPKERPARPVIVYAPRSLVTIATITVTITLARPLALSLARTGSPCDRSLGPLGRVPPTLVVVAASSPPAHGLENTRRAEQPTTTLACSLVFSSCFPFPFPFESSSLLIARFLRSFCYLYTPGSAVLREDADEVTYVRVTCWWVGAWSLRVRRSPLDPPESSVVYLLGTGRNRAFCILVCMRNTGSLCCVIGARGRRAGLGVCV